MNQITVFFFLFSLYDSTSLLVSKPADELWILESMVTGTRDTLFYSGPGPLDGGKTYVLLLFILMEYQVHS
jgi:hypothetical protein